MVEGEPQLEQQAALQDAGGHGGVADRAEQDRVVVLEALKFRVGQGFPGRVPAPRAEVVLPGLQLHVLRKHRREHFEALGHHFLADSVTGDHCEANAARHARTLLVVPLSALSGSGLSMVWCVRGWYRQCLPPRLVHPEDARLFLSPQCLQAHP